MTYEKKTSKNLENLSAVQKIKTAPSSKHPLFMYKFFSNKVIRFLLENGHIL